MKSNMALDFQQLRKQIIGADAPIQTPFGQRLMVYADYTASGRCLMMVERYLQHLQRIYANSHTEDDISGRSMTHLLHEAESAIKQSVHAGPGGRIVPVGSGATGAIDKFQQIIGVMLPPATRDRLESLLAESLGSEAQSSFMDYLGSHQPVVFVGPFEHHSNEVSWRQGLATVVEVPLDSEGGVDLVRLEELLQDPRYQNRPRLGSFSAASNVTGMRSPVHEIATLLHRYGAFACFDYAASAPYVEINMNPAPELYDGDASLDAVFISPHKFLGGPGSSGILLFNDRLYRKDLPPSVAAGGTVDYVGPSSQDFIEDIEEREKAGTPGVLQILKAGLAFQIKDSLGVAAIEQREQELLQNVFQRWQKNTAIEILGHPDPQRRIGIISFNLREPQGSYLHPKFVTTLLNDLFGIQSRAGCSCAGPYGHRLLGIGEDRSEQYRKWIKQGYSGIKPGWCRISLHYSMDEAEVAYIADAIEFVAQRGHRFLPLYDFDMHTGGWKHKQDELCLEAFSLQAAMEHLSPTSSTALEAMQRSEHYQQYLAFAEQLATQLGEMDDPNPLELLAEVNELRFFSLPSVCGKRQPT
jgi:selenocysteine lyase/cysteine desulfurase